MQPIGPTNEQTRRLIISLEKFGKKNKQDVWLAIAEKLQKSRRQKVAVNLGKIDIFAKKHQDKIFVVPGKVLSDGLLTTKAKIAGMQFSKVAKEKISAAKGQSMQLQELMDAKPKASEIMIVC